MPIDARIPLQGIQPEPLINTFAKMQSIRGAQQENALRAAQMDEYQRKLQDQNALRSTLAGFTPDMTAEQQVSALQRGGHLTEARLLAESSAKTAADKRAEEKSALEAEHKRLEIRGQVYGSVAATPTIEAAQDALKYLVDNKLVDPANANTVWQQIQANPTPDNIRGLAQRFQVMSLNTKDQLEKHYVTQDYGGGSRLLATSKYIPGPASVVEGSDVRTTLKPGEAERDAETRRHNVETERAATDRLAFDREKMGAGGEIDAKEKSKREAAYPKVSGAYRAATHEIDSLITDIESLRKHSGLSGITGLVAGRTPNVTGPARQAQAILDRVLAKGQFRGLQAMREASPTGGALGNISDKEGAALRAAFGALNQTQDTKDFKTALENVLSDLKFSKGNIDQTYADTYAYKGGNTPSAADHSKKTDAEILAELGVKP